MSKRKTSSQSNGSSNQNNTKKWCATCNKHGSHTTKECWNKQSNNNNNNKNSKATEKCGNCGKLGHATDNCRSKKSDDGKAGQNSRFEGSRVYNTNNTPDSKFKSTDKDNDTPMVGNYTSIGHAFVAKDQQKNGPLPQVAAMPYCRFCNVTSHKTEDCKNDQAIVNFQRSPFLCVLCVHKGHLAQNCMNPVYKEVCMKCSRRGHTTQECQVNPKAGISGGFRDYLHQQQPSSGFFFGGEEAHNLRRQWDEKRREEAAAGRTISQADNDEAERRIREAAVRDIAKKSSVTTTKASTSNILSTKSVAPTTQANNTITNKDGATRSFTSLDTFDSKFEFNHEKIMAMRNAGFQHTEIQAYEKFCTHKTLEQKSALELKMTKKIDASLCYPKSQITRVLPGQFNWISENQVLTQRRLDDVKSELSRGSSFWRDPGAMAALYYKKIPVCDGCKCEGAIFDRHFTKIDKLICDEDILDLEDLPFWGLFVVLPCGCSGKRGYTYHKVPNTELFAMNEKYEADKLAKTSCCSRCS